MTDYDFDWNFDWNFDFGEKTVGLRRRIKFDLCRSAAAIRGSCVPDVGESIRLISPAGGFSSCAVVMAIADETKIRELKITTLRVGKKEALALERLNIPKVEIVCGGIALQNAKKYDYAKWLTEVGARNDWKICYTRNHSKIILLDTDRGKIVIETSSNFNENPQIEQVCITNDAAVYGFYLDGLRMNGVFV